MKFNLARCDTFAKTNSIFKYRFLITRVLEYLIVLYSFQVFSCANECCHIIPKELGIIMTVITPSTIPSKHNVITQLVETTATSAYDFDVVTLNFNWEYPFIFIYLFIFSSSRYLLVRTCKGICETSRLKTWNISP